MRINLLTLAVLLSTARVGVAQNPAPRGAELATYRFEASVPIAECDFNGQIGAAPATDQAPNGAEFFVVNEVLLPAAPPARPVSSSVIVLQFLLWDKADDEYATFNVDATKSLAPVRNWCVDRSNFDRFATRIYDSGLSSWDLAAGLLLLPIKMRLGGDGRPFDFSRDVTLGTVVGPRFRLTPIRDVHLSALIGAGITAVTLTPENTRGVLNGATDRAAVTLTGGVMLEVERFQIGIMTGTDRVSQPNQADWIYQGKRWLSVGLGYTLLSSPPQSPATGRQSSNN